MAVAVSSVVQIVATAATPRVAEGSGHRTRCSTPTGVRGMAGAPAVSALAGGRGRYRSLAANLSRSGGARCVQRSCPNRLRPTPVGTTRTSTPAVVVEAVIPLLRGWLHLVCFFLSFPAGLLVVANAHSPRARAAAIVYAIGVSTLFGVSATYHRRSWSAAARPRMKRLDHATIFVMIAANYTPLCLLALGGNLGGRILLAVWVAAGTGVILALTGIAEKAVVGLVIYIGLGWFMAAGPARAGPPIEHRRPGVAPGRRAPLHGGLHLHGHPVARPLPRRLRLPRGVAPHGRRRRRLPLRRHPHRGEGRDLRGLAGAPSSGLLRTRRGGRTQ